MKSKWIWTGLMVFILNAAAAERPNIVFMLADDLGYGDLPSFGAKDVQTPHLDRLAKEGIKFTQAYANGPECTPSRTAIHTGRHPQRPGGLECPLGTGNVGRYDDAIRLREKNDLGLPPNMAVLAPGLKQAGYATALIGKWHLGYEPKFNPLEQGFDRFFGILGGNVDYYRHVELSDLPVFMEDRQPVAREGYMTDLFRDESVAFIRQQTKVENPAPFFLFLAFTAPHFPFQPPGTADEPMPTAEQWTKGTRANYVKMIENMDEAAGAVMAALAETGADKNTLIVFASDHGAMQPGSNGPYRDYKETLFEGGIRTPVLARWPGRLKAGSVDDRPWMLMDLTASILALADAKVPDGRPLDGQPVLVDVIEGRESAPRDFYWRARRGDRTWRAVRSGGWKWISREDPGDKEEWLFNLSSDPTEKTDAKKSQRAEVTRLKALMMNWETEVKAER
ncbi:sulfatase-like hydrolase/transferase [Prosthecobacter sp. SYSU 5D2]|uniref:sulfatase family protein n=1 Tax=Prosthecobacter sp. SYSU 5D2 TaxID=3134134 RepID=UPI0031FE5CA8